MAAFTTIALLALAAGSTAVSAYGQHKAGQQAKKAGQQQREASESQAELADYNAAIAELQATDAEQRGAEEAARYRSRVRVMVGEQRAGFAASNVDVGFGSAVDVQADAAFLGELDALTVKTNAGREAWGYRVQAEDSRRRAQIARKEGVYLEAAGRQQASAANLAAAGTIIGGGASLLEARYGFRRPS